MKLKKYITLTLEIFNSHRRMPVHVSASLLSELEQISSAVF
jgi:hypothetical protein